MDQNVLVASGHALVKALDAIGIPPRAAVWVHNTDTDTWKLWIVPHKEVSDQRTFYRQVAEVVTKNRDQLSGLDASDTEMVSEAHPAIAGLSRIVRTRQRCYRVQYTKQHFRRFLLT